MSINPLGAGGLAHGLEKPNSYYDKIDQASNKNINKNSAANNSTRATSFNNTLQKYNINPAKDIDNKNSLPTKISNNIAAATAIAATQAAINNQQIASSYNNTATHKINGENKEIKSKAADKQKKPIDNKDNGIDFALKESANKLEKQILGILWNLMFSGQGDKEYLGGSGEMMFMPELVNNYILASEEPGEIAREIYEEYKTNMSTADKAKLASG